MYCGILIKFIVRDIERTPLQMTINGVHVRKHDVVHAGDFWKYVPGALQENIRLSRIDVIK